MTRLTDALARAGGADQSMPTLDPLDKVVDVAAVVPTAWQFDAVAPEDGTQHRPEQAPAPAPVVVDATAVEPAESPAPTVSAQTLPLTRTLVVGPNPNAMLVEQYRHLAAALHHAKLNTGARTVMVASAVQAEGKTTTATNIALTLSESHQRRVLLIDADLRRPSIHSILGLSNRSGLAATLRDVAPNATVPLHRVSPTLSVITAGKPTEDPMSALVSDTMRRFLEEAAEQYDWVVIDTPPVALLSDANLLAAMVDLAILVVGAGSTPFPLVRRAVEAIGPSKILGVVLNRAERSDLSVGYGYGYDAYSYSYGQPATSPRRWPNPFRRDR